MGARSLARGVFAGVSVLFRAALLVFVAPSSMSEVRSAHPGITHILGPSQEVSA